MKLVTYLCLILCVMGSATAAAQLQADEAEATYLYKMEVKGSDTLRYRIMYPYDFDESQSYPLVIFFHGMGERGTDNERQLYHGSRMFKDSLRQYPAIVVFPQCPPTDYWANLYRPDEGGASRRFDFYYNDEPNPTMGIVIDVVDALAAQDFVDESRIYASGLSMGGMGTFEFAYRMNDKLACAMPICGGGPRDKAAGMVDVPFWIFHGMKDDVVAPRYSISMLKAIQQAGGQAKITLFEDANHNSWDPAFAEPDYLSWMFGNKRGGS